MRQLRMEFTSKMHPEMIFSIFNYFDDICFFIKDLDGSLIVANQQLLKRYNLESEKELLGKTDFDFVPFSLAEKYKEDDIRIIKTKQPMLNILELALNSVGIPDWFITNKLPIICMNGEVIGIMGTIRNITIGMQAVLDTNYIYKAMQYINENYNQRLSVNEIANLYGLSIRDFERKFKKITNLSPEQFIIKTRLFRSFDSLKKCKNITEIAIDCGFYDQSSFTKHFKKHMGITPKQYIKKYG